MKKLLHVILLLDSSLQAQNAAKALSITDGEEIKLGQGLAKSFARREGIEPTPQTRKIEEYLQRVGDHVAAYAQRKLPYQFHFDPDPGFKSAVVLPGGQIFIESRTALQEICLRVGFAPDIRLRRQRNPGWQNFVGAPIGTLPL